MPCRVTNAALLIPRDVLLLVVVGDLGSFCGRYQLITRQRFDLDLRSQ